jgi:hypothetical protein
VNTGAVTSVIRNGRVKHCGRKGHWHKPGKQLETCDHLPGSVAPANGRNSEAIILPPFRSRPFDRMMKIKKN